MIELCYKDVKPVCRNGKYDDNPKALKYFINNHVVEKCGFEVSFLISSIKHTNADVTNHEKIAEKSTKLTSLPTKRERYLDQDMVVCFSLIFYP